MIKLLTFATLATLLSVSSYADELKVHLKKGDEYQNVKPALLKAGWKPVEFKENNVELPEIHNCQQGGLGQCGRAARKLRRDAVPTVNVGEAFL